MSVSTTAARADAGRDGPSGDGAVTSADARLPALDGPSSDAPASVDASTTLPTWDLTESGLDSTGWTILPPDPVGMTLYVSPTGSDSNSGLSMTSPIQSIDKLNTLLRDGSHTNPPYQHVMFERGGTYSTATGLSLSEYLTHATATNPFVVGAYGTGPRPMLQTTAQVAAILGPHAGAHVWIVDLAIVNVTMGNNGSDSVGVYFAGPAYDDVLLEGLYIAGFYDNISLQTSNPGDGGAPSPFTNVRIRRNVIVDSHGNSTDSTDRSQGLYAEHVVNGLVEENIFDNNGGGTTTISPQAHTIYWQAGSFNATFRGNTVMEAPDSVQLRAGGTADDNLFYKNAIALAFACLGDIGVGNVYPYKPGESAPYGITPFTSCLGVMKNNVLLDGDDIPSYNYRTDGGTATQLQPRAWGLEMGVTSGIPTSAPANATIAGNLLAHVIPSTQDYASPFAISVSGPFETASITGNVIYDWGRGLIVSQELNVSNPSPAGATASVTGNQIQLHQTAPSNDPALDYVLDVDLANTKLTAQGNTYYSPASTPFGTGSPITGERTPYSGWTAKVADQGSSFTDLAYAGLDPSVDLGDYYAAVTGATANSTSAAAYITAARAQSKTTWNPAITAYAANAWFRSKFGVADAP